MSGIKENDVVKVHYTLNLENGKTFETTLKSEPLEFRIGEGGIIPGFELGLLGLKKGDKKEIRIPYEEAYGDRNPELLYEIPKEKLPDKAKPEIGLKLVSKLPDEKKMDLYVVEIRDNTVVLDGNHPLAGKNLIFNIEVVDVLQD